MPAGARSLIAISEWIADAPRWALRALGFTCDPLTGHLAVPHPGTVRRLPARLDGDAAGPASARGRIRGVTSPANVTDVTSPTDTIAARTFALKIMPSTMSPARPLIR